MARELARAGRPMPRAGRATGPAADLVVPKRPHIPAIVTADRHRRPAHARASGGAGADPRRRRAHRRAQRQPLHRTLPTTAEHVRAALGRICGAGRRPTQVGIESTVISLAGPASPAAAGMIAFDSMRQVSNVTNPAEAHPAPGMHLRHYSPRTRLILVENEHQLPSEGQGVYVSKSVEVSSPGVEKLQNKPTEYAAALYDTLHRLDAEGWDWIAVERPPDTPEWAGILDRLERAAR